MTQLPSSKNCSSELWQVKHWSGPGPEHSWQDEEHSLQMLSSSGNCPLLQAVTQVPWSGMRTYPE